MEQILTLPLPEYITFPIGRAYLSGLRFLNGWHFIQPAGLPREIPLEALSLLKWNGALDYLVHEPP